MRRCKFTLVFFKALCHANPRAERYFAGSSSFQGTYFESSQIHQLIIMYRFDRTNHDILLFQSLKTLFACG